MNFGTVEGQKVESEKDAQKMAENYVKDQQYKENSNATQVFMDKEAYKAAEKARKEQRKQLIEQYRNEGLSKKEAKQKADAQLPENEYLRKGLFGQNKTRKYIESHKELFYDENGNFSSDKFKQTALKFANTHTEEGEAENHYLSLKERREVAEKENVKASVIKNIAKKSNLGYEKDNRRERPRSGGAYGSGSRAYARGDRISRMGIKQVEKADEIVICKTRRTGLFHRLTDRKGLAGS